VLAYHEFVLVVLIVGLSGVFIARILMNRPDLKDKYQKKTEKMQDEYILELEEKVKKYKNKSSNMERGPQLEGNIDELDQILPNLVNEFKPYAPKWLQPLLGDSSTQKWIVKYLQEHPDKLKQYFGRMVKKKGVTSEQTTTGEAPSTTAL